MTTVAIALITKRGRNMEKQITKETKFRFASSILLCISALFISEFFIKTAFLVVAIVGICTCNKPNKKATVSSMIVLMALSVIQLINTIPMYIEEYIYLLSWGDRYAIIYISYVIEISLMVSSLILFAIGNLTKVKALPIIATALLGGIVTSGLVANLFIYPQYIDALYFLVGILSSLFSDIIVYGVLAFAFIFNIKGYAKETKALSTAFEEVRFD